MTCSQCGATIAEKALICYKCGTQTTAPRHQPAVITPPRRWVGPVLAAAAAGAALLGWAWQSGFFN